MDPGGWQARGLQNRLRGAVEASWVGSIPIHPRQPRIKAEWWVGEYDGRRLGDVDVPPAPLFKRVVVGGSALECLIFGGFGAYSLLLGIALNGRVDALGNDLNFLAAAALFALAAGFGVGAFLISFRWFEARIVGARIMGAVLHLCATAVAAWVSISAGVYQIGVDRSYGYWPPWIAFAIGAGVIAVGIAVLASMFLPVRRKSARRASQ
jgi:hypothetical protein